MGKQNPFLFKEISRTEHWRVPEIILTQCLKHPNRKIIEFTDGPEWTFKDLKIKSLRKARILKNLNLKAGDSLTVIIEDPKEFILYWIASNFLGVMFVALNTAVKGKGLLHQINTSKSKHVIVENLFFDEVNNLKNTYKLDVEILNCSELQNKEIINENEVVFGKLSDNVCSMFTSGTSGPSKGVMMPNAHCVLFAIGTIENYDLKHDHVFYISLPLFLSLIHI